MQSPVSGSPSGPSRFDEDHPDRRVFLPFDISSIEPDDGGPDPDLVVKGHPRIRTWVVEERSADRLYAGVCEATPGAWRIVCEEWKFYSILAGVSVIHESGVETPRILRAGDSFILRPGFSGIWEVVETTRKLFVVSLPPPTTPR